MYRLICIIIVAIFALACRPEECRANPSDNKVGARFLQTSEVEKSVDDKRSGYEWKDWTPAECDEIRAVLSEMRKKAPDFLEAASNGEDLTFVRVGALDDSKHLPRTAEFIHWQGPVAAAGIDFVIITDRFFEPRLKSHQFHGLAHELVHLMDYGDYISYRFLFWQVKRFARLRCLLKNDSDIHGKECNFTLIGFAGPNVTDGRGLTVSALSTSI